jgi:hypothetical protein
MSTIVGRDVCRAMKTRSRQPPPQKKREPGASNARLSLNGSDGSYASRFVTLLPWVNSNR